ncbi:hypothetical protein EWM64_g9495 [Hericium alpestre]|uniref:Uncharacterized protein n=1 Tax=Hericium alpestre TaxID=135208 RepID=A0A4Y9ZKG6_9AGAM|nr:hypothetical protein EWM64_g9495 [Hericium alpestre]
MPSEHVHLTSQPQQADLPQGQVKLCSRCHCPLSPDVDMPAFYLYDSPDASDAVMTCRGCRDRAPQRAFQLDPERPPYVPPQDALMRRAPTHGINEADHISLIGSFDPSVNENHQMDASTIAYSSSTLARYERGPVVSPLSEPAARPSPPATNSKPTRLTINTTHAPLPVARPSPSSPLISPRTASSSKVAPTHYVSAAPDPFVDITRLRMRSRGHHCLYPGATFQGTQKSGRSSYDVTVSIVDVDFSSSFLCGYLCIRGLTEDWPELTTYFDAEIIGSRYGFLTRNWGANEQEDMVHWARFPAFRHVKSKLKMPHLTVDGDCGAVFMRWKERFLVPDHRVQDIHGASFAGFYYVCVDFNSHPPSPTTSRPTIASRSPIRDEASGELGASPKPEPPRRSRGQSIHDDALARRSSSIGARAGPPVATMSGFYFHQNSEPYQQLSLQHVPERVSTSFEMR